MYHTHRMAPPGCNPPASEGRGLHGGATCRLAARLRSGPTPCRQKDVPASPPPGSAPPPWSERPAASSLHTDHVHVWRARLAVSPRLLTDLEKALSDDERCRADRLPSEPHRSHFIAARGLLRVILAGYVADVPQALRFAYSPHGKPALIGRHRDTLRFNMAHSHGLALYAVASTRTVGIDVERIRDDVPSDRIADRFFTPAEVASLRTLPAARRTETFFRYWTRKEAYIKGKGGSLWHVLGGVDVASSPRTGEAIRVGGATDPRMPATWTITDLDAAPGYAAAVAVEGSGVRISCWQWRA